jgi:hypothetical protein
LYHIEKSNDDPVVLARMVNVEPKLIKTEEESKDRFYDRSATGYRIEYYKAIILKGN